MEVSSLFHAPAALSLRERAYFTHLIRSWVGPEAAWMTWKKEKFCPDKDTNRGLREYKPRALPLDEPAL